MIAASGSELVLPAKRPPPQVAHVPDHAPVEESRSSPSCSGCFARAECWTSAQGTAVLDRGRGGRMGRRGGRRADRAQHCCPWSGVGPVRRPRFSDLGFRRSCLSRPVLSPHSGGSAGPAQPAARVSPNIDTHLANGKSTWSLSGECTAQGYVGRWFRGGKRPHILVAERESVWPTPDSFHRMLAVRRICRLRCRTLVSPRSNFCRVAGSDLELPHPGGDSLCERTSSDPSGATN